MGCRFLSIIGTRPQYIKVLDNLPNHVVVDTRQHYDENMSDIFIKQLKIRPKYNLNCKELGDMIKKCSEVIGRENPDIVIVYGDTRCILAGALSAKFANKTLVHVESGMRCRDISQPEELVRIIVDRISDYRFCTNEFARQNLINESIRENVHVVGDVMWDALSKVLPIKKTQDYEKFNLLTLHRAVNTENESGIRNIFQAIEESEERFIFPIHPRTKKLIRKFKISIPKNIELLPPQGYKEMVSLETNAKKIVTDSGGVSREAYWFMKPLIILRNETEWMEIVADGWGILVGTNKALIVKALKDHNPHPLKNKPNYIPQFGAKERIKD